MPFSRADGEPPPGIPAVEEACVIGIVPDVPSSALLLARLVRSEGLWRVDPAFVVPRVRGSGIGAGVSRERQSRDAK